MTTQTVDQQIRDFISDNFLYGQSASSLRADDSFLETGLIDSTGVLELVTFLETTFHIVLDDQELIPDNLDSLAKLEAFIQRKLGN